MVISLLLLIGIGVYFYPKIGLLGVILLVVLAIAAMYGLGYVIDLFATNASNEKSDDEDHPKKRWKAPYENRESGLLDLWDGLYCRNCKHYEEGYCRCSLTYNDVDYYDTCSCFERK